MSHFGLYDLYENAHKMSTIIEKHLLDQRINVQPVYYDSCKCPYCVTAVEQRSEYCKSCLREQNYDNILKKHLVSYLNRCPPNGDFHYCRRLSEEAALL